MPQVIIVGAGPVGLSLALGLSRYGVASVVLEREQELCPESRAPGVLPRSLEVFSKLGILDSCLQEGIVLKQVRLLQAQSERTLFEFDFERLLREQTIAPYLMILPQDRTVRLLADAVAKTPLVEVRLGHRVDAIEAGDRVTARVTSSDGQSYPLEAEYLVACDGARSTVRTSLGLELEGKTYQSELMLIDVVPKPAVDLGFPRVTRNPSGRGVVAALRMDKRRWRLIATLEPGETREQVLEPRAMADKVKRVLGVDTYELVWANTFRIHCRTSPKFRIGRVILAGDAAHINSPAGGQGMNGGIQDAFNLSWKLAAALQGGDSDALLNSYEIERRHAVISNVDKYTDLVTRLGLLAPPRVAALTGAVVRRLSRIDAVARRMISRAAMFDTHYANSPCLLGTHSMTGRRAPDGILKRPDGSVVRLHDLVFPHAAMIEFVSRSETVGNSPSLPVPLYRIHRKSAPAHNAHDLVDETGGLWRDWRACDGLTALIRPDAHIGWVETAPAQQAKVQAIQHVLRMRDV